MGEPGGPTYPAYVYNCRTTNAWEMDLALTATYFPHCNMTFAIVFGCPFSVEEEIIQRLTFAAAEAAPAHPLLMPGIIAEIERARHVHIIEDRIDDLEARILQLDLPESEKEEQNQEQRTAWLDTTYLRNALVSWNTQLAMMGEHADELKNTIFKPVRSRQEIAFAKPIVQRQGSDIPAKSNRPYKTHLTRQSDLSDASCDEWVELSEEELVNERLDFKRSHVPRENTEDSRPRKTSRTSQRCESISSSQDPEEDKIQMRRVGRKIKDRIQAICNEYDDKIRDCSTRIDGMAMATQWAQGETNVEIALSTSRESKHMRSIAIVTMVFLPGTFLASVFSMTFFNWSNSEGSVVSGYVWIYVLVTVIFTLMTIGSWWYFVIYRRSRRHKEPSEVERLLV